MKSFLICPVRGMSPDAHKTTVDALEALGFAVHWPPRDTDQTDEVGLRICRDNAAAIAAADVVHVIWDGKSQGCLFDLGVAFALGKKLEVILIPALSEGKSFQNMMAAWSCEVIHGVAQGSMRAIADDCREAARTYRRRITQSLSADSVVAIYERIAESIDRAIAAQPPAAPVENKKGDQIHWLKVNDEPFEYAIQQGPNGDEFVKLLSGECLRRTLCRSSAETARVDALEAQGTIEQLEKQLAYERKKSEANFLHAPRATLWRINLLCEQQELYTKDELVGLVQKVVQEAGPKERCPACGHADLIYSRLVEPKCNDPWHADAYLRAQPQGVRVQCAEDKDTMISLAFVIEDATQPDFLQDILLDRSDRLLIIKALRHSASATNGRSEPQNEPMSKTAREILQDFVTAYGSQESTTATLDAALRTAQAFLASGGKR